MRKYITVFLFLSSLCAAQGQTFVSGQAARATFGQTTFTVANALPSQQVLGGVSGLAYANGTLFVADSNVIGAQPQDNRVLMFDTSSIPPARADLTVNYTPQSADCYLCGFNAINSLGQPTYNPPAANTPPCNASVQEFCPGTSKDPTQPQMQIPTAVATDGQHLAIADTNNNRVLIWNSIPAAMNQSPDLVLGQSSFTTNSTPKIPTASSLSGPQGVWFQSGRLYVADTQNSRILIWNSLPTTNNQPADMVLGQSNFTTGTEQACHPSAAGTPVEVEANQLCNPVSVTSDGTHLFVSDLGFNRVLIWNSIPTSNGQPADVAVGQPDLHSTAANFTNVLCPGIAANSNGTYPPCAATLDTPRYALSDGTRLFIADGGNDRVLIFNHIPTTNGASADIVLGQPNFTTDIVTSQSISIASTAIDNTAAVDTVPSPMSLAYDGTNLYVSDPYNRRVLVFTPGDTPLPDSSIVNWASEIIRQEGVVTIGVTTITSGDTVTISIAGTNYVYTVKSGDTADSIAQGLVSKINSGSGDPNATAIFAGAGTGTLYLSSKGVNLGYDTISLSATASNTGDLTVTASGSYLSAGTAATGAPGMLVEINGSNFTDSTSTVTAPSSGNLPTTLGGAQVYMDGIPSPIFSVSSHQIISQIPFSFNGRNSTSVYVRTVHTNGNVTVTNASPVYIAPANPGIFNAPAFAGQPRPWPASQVFHQSGNPTAVVSIDGSVHAGDTATITVNGRNYTYTVVSTDTLTSIVQNLVNKINGTPDPQVVASVGAAFNRVVLTAREPGSAGSGIPVAGSSSSNAQVTITAYTSSTCCAVTPNTPVTPSNPAAPGELITVQTDGLGPVTDLNGNVININSGSPYNGPQPNIAQNSVSATMGGSTAEVISAGLAPNSYGVYQIQLIVPSGAATNPSTQLYIAQNAYISNTVTVPVGPATEVGTGGSGVSTVTGVTFSASPNPIPWGPGSVGSTTLTWGGAPGNVVVYQGRPSTGATQLGFGGSSGTLTVNNVPDGTTFYLQDMTNSVPTSDAATLATVMVHVSAPITIDFDNPTLGSAPLVGTIMAGGWVVDQNAAITSLSFLVDGVPVGDAIYGVARPDVCAVYPNSVGCPNVGWNYSLDTTLLTNGSHNVQITATDASGAHASSSVPITVANQRTSASPTAVYIDTPGPGTPSFQGLVTFSGWAFNTTAPLAGVSVTIDGVPYGTATYGGSSGYRPDVCNAFPGSPDCPAVGWNILVDTGALSNGPHTLGVTATASNGQHAVASAAFTVANWTSANPTTIDIDSPNAQSGAFSGTAVAFGGWAINNSGPILNLTATIDGAPYGSVIYGVNRPDVCNAYPGRAGCPNVGWNLIVDTTQIGDGMHTLAITAYTLGGQSSTVSTSFTVSNLNASNPIKLGIDTPSKSVNYSGSAHFGGWALSTNAPISSVQVLIDGMPYGTATYGGSRPDACASNSGSPNCPNVGWDIFVDTTMFPNGPHTAEVKVTSSTGQTAIGTASFTIANSNSSGPGHVLIDQPNGSSNPLQGLAYVSGWAVNDNALVTTVQIFVDGVQVGTANYGGNRPDVCNVLPGRPNCPNVGWTYLLDSTTIPDGTHTLGVVAIAADGSRGTASTTFTVGNWTTPDPMTIAIDNPNPSSPAFFNTVVFGGWAIDKSAQIVDVKVAVDGAPLGTAVYGVNRPDVCNANPGSPGCPNVGWDIAVDTTLLSNGIHTLQVTAFTATGQSATATSTFTVTN